MPERKREKEDEGEVLEEHMEDDEDEAKDAQARERKPLTLSPT